MTGVDTCQEFGGGLVGENGAKEKVGKIFKVVIDRKEGDYYVGRTEYCSPEVDPEVLIPVGKKVLCVGNFYSVRITESDEFDLFGEVVSYDD